MRLNVFKLRRVLTLFVVTIGLMSSFQNCSPVSFKPTAGVNNAQSVPTTPISPTSACSPNSTNDVTDCLPAANSVCTTFVELKPSLATATSDPSFLGTVTVPVADQKGTCYYTHMINAVDQGAAVSSTTWQTFRSDVISAYHTTTNDSQAVLSQIDGPVGHANYTPRVIGSTINRNGSINTGATASVQFTLEGPRVITLAGNSNGTQTMAVDNFILLEMNSKTQGSTALAEGSQDAPPWAQPMNTVNAAQAPITVGGVGIPFVSFGPGGTVNINPKDISTFFPVLDPISLRTTGLDCGGVGDISDVYILFQ